MKIVLDTNVLIAAFIARGVCSDLLEHCARQILQSTRQLVSEMPLDSRLVSLSIGCWQL